MCWMQNDCSTGVSRAPCWHGNSSLNKTNHRRGTMLIKTKAHSVADGTSHQIVFTHFHKATIIPPPSAVIDGYNHKDAVISSLPISPPLLSVCWNLFSSLVDHVQLKFARNTDGQGDERWVAGMQFCLSLTKSFPACWSLSHNLCSSVNWSATWTLSFDLVWFKKVCVQVRVCR